MRDAAFQFAYPQLFALFIPLALWLYLVLRKGPSAITFPGASALKAVAGPGDRARARVPLILRTVALGLLICALGRPQTFNVSRETSSPGVDIILCVDTSETMQGLDFTLDGRPVERLTAAKKVMSDFIKKRPGDRIGLVVFGAEAFTQAPLTQDKGMLLALVSRLRIGMAGRATAIGDALAVAGKRIKNVPAPSKIVILLTDGRQNAGAVSATEAASALSALGIKIYTVGVGTRKPVPFRVRGFFGDQTVYEDVPMDEDLLKEVASIANGRYYLAGDTASLEAIYEEINKAEKTEIKVKEFFHFKEKYIWFVIPALFLLLVELAGARMRAVP